MSISQYFNIIKIHKKKQIFKYERTIIFPTEIKNLFYNKKKIINRKDFPTEQYLLFVNKFLLHYEHCTYIILRNNNGKW